MSAIPEQKLHIYEFGPFRLDAEERLLFRAQEPVPLTPKVVDTLLVLIENRGRLLAKDALMNAVWPDSFVEESSLAQNISLLRKALGEEHGGRQYIETLPRRGYRFMAEVREVRKEGGAFFVERRTDSQFLIEEEEETETVAIHAPENALPPSVNPLRGWRRYLVTALAVLGVVAGLSLWQARWKNADADASLPVKSIAVLPFKTLGEQSEPDLVGLGMTDALILRLAQLEKLSVLPTSSVFKFLNRESDALTIGRELGVEGVLDGTVQRSGDRVRVTAQLIRISDGKTLWVGKFDEQFADIFVVQDSVSEQLAYALSLKVADPTNQHLKKRFTHNAEAYQLYTRGLYFWNRRTAEGLNKAIEYFTQATEKDPNFALAYASLADSHMLIGFYGYGNVPPEIVRANVKTAATKAVELDPTLAESQTAMAVAKVLEGDYEEAEKLYRRAVELNPNCGTAQLRYGYLLANRGRLDEAIQKMQRAHELDPLSATINVNLGAYYSFKRQYDLSMKHSKLALETNPETWQARVNLAEAYEAQGKYAEAETHFKKIGELPGLAVLSNQQLAYLYAVSGRQTEARKLLAEVEKAYRERKSLSMTPYSIAQVYVALGQPDEAFKWLNNAFETRRLLLPDFRYSDKLNPIRQDPRFQDLQQRVDERHRLRPQSTAKR